MDITLFYRTNPRAMHTIEHPPTSTAEHMITSEVVSNERVTTVDGIGGVESRKTLRVIEPRLAKVDNEELGAPSGEKENRKADVGEQRPK